MPKHEDIVALENEALSAEAERRYEDALAAHSQALALARERGESKVTAVLFSRIGQVLAGLPADPGQRRFVGSLLVAFLPALVLGALLHGLIKAYLFNPLTVAGALIAGGLAILYIERRAFQPHCERVEAIRWRTALKIGFAQTLALFPGVSRAGATLRGGLLFGLSRTAATEFSFFLAIPTMLSATVYDLYQNWDLLSGRDLPVFAVGFCAAFGAAMLAVRTLLRFVSRHSFVGFAWYRILFGLVVLGSATTGLVSW